MREFSYCCNTGSTKRLVMKNFIVTFCLSFLGLTACKQEELPDPTSDEPVFQASGTIDGQPHTIQAGEDDYYMHTSFSSDSNNLYQLTGHLKQVDCQECVKSLKIEFPAQMNAKEELNLGGALKTGEHTYYDPYPAYKVNFNPVPKGPDPRSFLWDFGDEVSSHKKQPSHYYPVTGKDEYPASLRINYNNGECISTSTQKVSLEQESCRANYEAEPINQTEVKFTSDARNLTPPLEHRWYKGGLLISKVADPTHDFHNPGVYEVCLEVSGASGCSATRCREIDVFSKECNANFKYAIEEDTVKVDPAFVNIAWRDADGTLYKTGKNEQPDRSYFKILKAEPYEANKNGYPTYQLKVAFDCMVYSGNQSKRLKDFEGTVAVAYPRDKR